MFSGFISEDLITLLFYEQRYKGYWKNNKKYSANMDKITSP